MNGRAQTQQPRPVWAIGDRSHVFIGHVELWKLLYIGPMMEDDWRPGDEGTFLDPELPNSVARNDSLTLARIWRKRLSRAPNSTDPEVTRLLEDLIALFLSGSVTVTFGPDPDLVSKDPRLNPDLPSYLQPVPDEEIPRELLPERCPDYPIYMHDLPPEHQLEGLRLMREMMRESFPEIERLTDDEQLLESLQGIDLRLALMRSE